MINKQCSGVEDGIVEYVLYVLCISAFDNWDCLAGFVHHGPISVAFLKLVYILIW